MNNKKTFQEFIDYTWKAYPYMDQFPERFAMLKTWDYSGDNDAYMWELYPNNEDLSKRTAMLKAKNFLIGKYDQEEKERLEIAEDIKKRMIANGFGPK